MNELSIDIQQRSKSAQLIWGALTACCAFFAILPFVSTMTLQGTPPSQATVQHLRSVFYIMAAMMAVSSLFLRFYMLSDQRLKDFIDRTVKSGDQTAALRKVIPHWFMFNILAWGLNESIASLGLMTAMYTREPNTIYPFVATALVLNFLMRPDLNGTLTRLGGRVLGDA